MTDLRSLGEIAARTSMLEVACLRCERRGRYRLDMLIARHGADAGAWVIAPELTADCPVCYKRCRDPCRTHRQPWEWRASNM